MQLRIRHEWGVSVAEAREIQLRLRDKVSLEPLRREVNIVTGVDISFSKNADDLYSAAVVYSLSSKEIIETQTACVKSNFPYIPGYLSFREIPAALAAIEKLKSKPELVICDGQGLAHPRRFGLACHLGVLLGIPTIGCAKSRLVGEYDEPGLEKGSMSSLLYQGKVVGAVLRTRESVKPVFVSPGHFITTKEAVRLIQKSVGRYRLPEPTRLAHIRVNEVRKGMRSKKTSC